MSDFYYDVFIETEQTKSAYQKSKVANPTGPQQPNEIRGNHIHYKRIETLGRFSYMLLTY